MGLVLLRFGTDYDGFVVESLANIISETGRMCDNIRHPPLHFFLSTLLKSTRDLLAAFEEVDKFVSMPMPEILEHNFRSGINKLLRPLILYLS